MSHLCTGSDQPVLMLKIYSYRFGDCPECLQKFDYGISAGTLSDKLCSVRNTDQKDQIPFQIFG